MTRRRLLAGVLAVGLANCLVWFVGAWFLWSIRYLFASPGSGQADDNTRLALETTAATAVTVIALVVFLVRRRGWSWWLLAVALVADLAFSVVEAVVRERTWWLFAVCAAATLALLYLWRRAPLSSDRARPARE